MGGGGHGFVSVVCSIFGTAIYMWNKRTVIAQEKALPRRNPR
jgi:hypothetical protein